MEIVSLCVCVEEPNNIQAGTQRFLRRGGSSGSVLEQVHSHEPDDCSEFNTFTVVPEVWRGETGRAGMGAARSGDISVSFSEMMCLTAAFVAWHKDALTAEV